MGSKSPQPEQITRRERRAQQRAQRAAAEAAARQRPGAGRRWIVAVAAVAIVAALGIMFALGRLGPSSPAGEANAPVSPTVLQALTTVPVDRLNAVGRGSVTTMPAPVRADVLKGSNGLPQIVYIGAEYCPFCAAERWPLIIALSRFGSFSGLETARSAADDVYPSTPTFTFVNATYTSQYLDFSPVELQTSTKVNGRYQPLQTPTPLQEQIITKYDAPPYVPASSAGSIPFTSFANQYVQAGASYDVGLINGASWEAIATSLADPSGKTGQAILGSANVLTAAICAATGDQPADVCGQPAVKTIRASLAQQPVPGGG